MRWYEGAALVGGVFALFAFVHSLCVTERVKRLAVRFLGGPFVKSFYRLLYSLFSAATTLIAAYLIALIPDVSVLSVPGWLRWLMHGAQAAGLFIGALSFRPFDTFEFLGISQALRYVRKQEASGDMEGIRENKLVTTGTYGIVRNPMYLGGILIFTFNPFITRTWLTLSLLADAYFVLGALIEEKRNIRRFGEEYRRYMSEVPLLIPSPGTLSCALKVGSGKKKRQ